MNQLDVADLKTMRQSFRSYTRCTDDVSSQRISISCELGIRSQLYDDPIVHVKRSNTIELLGKYYRARNKSEGQ